MFVVRIVSKVLVSSFAKQTSRSSPNTKSISVSVAIIRFGDSYTIIVSGRLANVFKVLILAFCLLGKKPKKLNLSLGMPDAESAVIKALGPGIGTTLTEFFFAAETNI